MKPFHSSTWAALGVATLLAACANSVPAPVLLSLPPSLGAAAPAAVNAAPPAAGASAPLLAIRRVAIPEYVVSRRVRFRTDASTLAEWPNTYWAERIEIGVTREFVTTLRAQLPGWSLCDTSCDDQAPTLALQVDVSPLDYLRSARRLQAHARITLNSTGAAPRALQTWDSDHDIAASADTPQAQAEAIAQLMRQLATSTAPLIRASAR